MNRRGFLGGLSLAAVSVAGCTSPPVTEPSPGTSDGTPKNAPATTGEPPSREFNEEALVQLYEFAATFRAEGDQQFDDGRSHWDTVEYQEASRRFVAAREKYDASFQLLARLTQRLEYDGLAGFGIADAAETHTDHRHSAANAFAQAAVSMADGETTTADSYRETAENFLVRAGNHDFATTQDFRTALKTTQ